jgi:hypothetical protein
MALSLTTLKSTKEASDKRPPITLIYGVDGVGKSTIASEWPDAIYLPTAGEQPPNDVDLPSPGEITTFDDLKGFVVDLLSDDHGFKTLIIDSLDGLEPIMNAETCNRIGAVSIDDNTQGSPTSYGRGYVEADVEWSDFMSACRALTERGIAVVILAHPEIKRFDSPVSDPYDRYGIKVHKRASALVRERSDIVAFMNYRVTLKTKEVAPKKVVGHAEGKERQIHLSESAGFVAKNRYAMPDSIIYRKGEGYSALQKYFPAPLGVPANDNHEEAAEAA